MPVDKEEVAFRTRLAERLLQTGLLDRHRLARAEGDSQPLDRALLRLGLVEEAALLPEVCNVLGFESFDATRHRVDPKAAASLTLPFLSARIALPLQSEGVDCLVAMADPANASLRTELAFLLDRPVRPVGAPTATIRMLIARLADPEEQRQSEAARPSQDRNLLTAADSDGPISRFAMEKLADAVAQGASDLHLESTDQGVALRFRINGVLVPQPMDATLDPAAVIARFKVMAGVNVAERRLPQDGRIEAMIAGRKIDFRFSSLPTHLGESIVARVLDPRQLRLGLDSLGFPPAIPARLRAILDRPSGLFLATGPTGSGKTTTLYAAIAHLNTPRRKIVTVEDPVEYNIAGVQQVQTHDEIGLTFARVLRGILRHDPNVILVGEIRDRETAEIAVRAAQVGRLVLSTLHTNSAAGAVTRLVDLGVPEFLVRDVLRGVLGQELRLMPCPSCGGAGCETCGGTGVGRREVQAELLEF
ncbi:GspE/PulE family protein [Neotabrizicola sp. sgz301269]|uniref:GspE/PulE family protein n=1 Tax=Neotabrizicola sp. sgz301269 TaxID=3276282 RepID=UPI00376FCA36